MPLQKDKNFIKFVFWKRRLWCHKSPLLFTAASPFIYIIVLPNIATAANIASAGDFFPSKRTYNNSCRCFDFSDLPHSVKFNIFPYLLKTLSHATSLEAVAFVMVPVFKPYWGFSACGCWRTLKIIKIQNIFFNLIFCVDRRNIERECCIVVFQPTLHSHVCTWL